jgi:glycosyltransferase involved in cell wall biosynthesis
MVFGNGILEKRNEEGKPAVMELKYSVLMSVYKNEDPEYFLHSVKSMLNQTTPPGEIVIVKDGPLPDELERVVTLLSKEQNIKFVPTDTNIGLGKALRIGLRHCSNELVARMDTNDIAYRNRCEKQLGYIKKHPSVSVVGTSVSEFIGNPDNIVSYRRVPENDKAIKKYMKTRNPFNHMTVMFKKSDVIQAGNYEHWHLNEDYYLWLRMLMNGCTFANINEPLVNMRIDDTTFERRGGWGYFLTQKRLLDFMLKNNIINTIVYVYNIIIRFIFRILITNKMRKFLYTKLLRSQ